MRIGIDARELLGDPTGVGRYLGELLRRWTLRPDAERRKFVLYIPEPLLLQFPPGSVEQRVIGSGRGTWWEQTWLRAAVTRDRPDVFFAPAYTAPLGTGCPLAVTIHDISFVVHPEWFRPREGMRRRWLTRRAAQSASVVFTVSEFSRCEIERYLRIDRSHIEVIRQGITRGVGARGDQGQPAREAVVTEEISARRRSEPRVLYVGSIFNRRRLPDLIAAFARAAADVPAARLVIVGDDRSWPPQDLSAVAAEHGVSERVELRSYVPDAELADLYATASVFAFLSEYEGFGLTPLEALAAGVPIVVLDTPVAREIYGDAAEYVQRGDIDGTAQALRRHLTSSGDRPAQLARAPAVLSRYSWDAAADRTLHHLERIARR